MASSTIEYRVFPDIPSSSTLTFFVSSDVQKAILEGNNNGDGGEQQEKGPYTAIDFSFIRSRNDVKANQLEWADFEIIVDRHRATLQHLRLCNLWNLQAPDYSIEVFQRCPKLTVVEIDGGCRSLDLNPLTKALCGLPTIQRVVIRHDLKPSSSPTTASASNANKRRRPRGSEPVTLPWLQAILRRCPNLKELYLEFRGHPLENEMELFETVLEVANSNNSDGCLKRFGYICSCKSVITPTVIARLIRDTHLQELDCSVKLRIPSLSSSALTQYYDLVEVGHSLRNNNSLRRLELLNDTSSSLRLPELEALEAALEQDNHTLQKFGVYSWYDVQRDGFRVHKHTTPVAKDAIPAFRKVQEYLQRNRRTQANKKDDDLTDWVKVSHKDGTHTP